MAEIKILVWKTSEPPTGASPEVEVRIPAALAKWVPKMMAFIPKTDREEIWGSGADLSMFADLEKMVNELPEAGVNEVMDVKTKDSRVKILVER